MPASDPGRATVAASAAAEIGFPSNFVALNRLSRSAATKFRFSRQGQKAPL